MEEDDQKKICAQCGHEKVLGKHFYRTKNGKDGYMKMCKDCFTENKQEHDRRAQLEMERIHREWEERRKLAREMEERHARAAEQAKKHRQEQQVLLDAWFAQQPPRTCIVCHETKAAIEFGYSEIATQENGHWLPARLHQRCLLCHELYREKYRRPCVICKRGIQDPMNYFEGYALFGGGVRIALCCQSCEPAFLALSRSQQQAHIANRVDALFLPPQQIYAEVDPTDQHIRYVGRSGHVQRRHSEHKRHIHQEQHVFTSYNQETKQVVETVWTSRANWMFALQQQGLEPRQRILYTVQPAWYVIEYERRFILHGIQQGWSLVNTEAFSDQKAQASTLDFLHAPFEALMDAGWFSKRSIEAFIRAYVHQLPLS